MGRIGRCLSVVLSVLAIGLFGSTAAIAQPQAKKPNIVIIWGDDIGQSNVSAYSHGLMGYQTPNIDRGTCPRCLHGGRRRYRIRHARTSPRLRETPLADAGEGLRQIGLYRRHILEVWRKDGRVSLRKLRLLGHGLGDVRMSVAAQRSSPSAPRRQRSVGIRSGTCGVGRAKSRQPSRDRPAHELSASPVRYARRSLKQRPAG